MFTKIFWGRKDRESQPEDYEAGKADDTLSSSLSNGIGNVSAQSKDITGFHVMKYPVIYKKNTGHVVDNKDPSTYNTSATKKSSSSMTSQSVSSSYHSSSSRSDNNNNNNVIPKRRYIKGYRRNYSLKNISFEKLSWITQEDDLKLIKSIIGAAYKCSQREDSSLRNVEVHDDTPSEERAQVSEGENMYLLYRVVISLCGNVTVSKRFLDTIEAKDSFRIDSIGVATYVPEDLCDESKDDIVTQIIVYVRSVDHQRLKKEIECNTFSQALNPVSQSSMKKKRKIRDF